MSDQQQAQDNTPQPRTGADPATGPDGNVLPTPPAEETVTTMENAMPAPPVEIRTMENAMPAPPALDLDGGK